MSYRFKWKPEMAFFLLTAGLTYLLQVLSTTDLNAVANWRTLLISVGAGLARALIGAALQLLTTRQPEREPEAEHIGLGRDEQ